MPESGTSGSVRDRVGQPPGLLDRDCYREAYTPLHPMQCEEEACTNSVSPGTVCCGAALGAGETCALGRLGVCYASCPPCKPSPPF
jgi:hypothetical protein